MSNTINPVLGFVALSTLKEYTNKQKESSGAQIRRACCEFLDNK